MLGQNDGDIKTEAGAESGEMKSCISRLGGYVFTRGKALPPSLLVGIILSVFAT